ncbi:MAG: cation:proton antiporter [Pirellulales bacterium]|nr:cation:proton antiporter [Pirellulales bacterium]
MEPQLLYLTGVLALGIAAQWLAWRFRLPAILLLLLLGFAAGAVAHPDELIGRELLFSVVSLSVAVILFEGGLSLRFRELREAGGAVVRLVTVGAAVAWLLGTAAATWLLDFEWPMAALLGAILVVTGPTVIVPLLRHVRPVQRVGAVAKWEGIVNDPIGAVLAVLVFNTVAAEGPSQVVVATILGLLATMLVGLGIAAATGAALVWLLRRYQIPDFLQSAVFLVAVLVSFTASNMLARESGLVAVTALGILLANQRAVTIKHVVEFKENLRVLLISGLFIVLGSRLKLDDLTALGWPGAGFLLAVLAIRPLAVLAATVRTGLNWRERIFLSWLAPRGIVAAAVSSVFALELAALAGEGRLPPRVLAQAEQLVPIVFLVIVGTVTVYGLTAAPLARWLKLAQPNPQGVLFAGAGPAARAIAEAVQGQGFEVLLVDTNSRNLAAARMRGLPTIWANILSGYLREEMDLGSLGRLAAMTPNDVVNTMATQEFVEFFGRSGVYQLAPSAVETERRERIPHERIGRVLFAEDMTFTRLSGRVAAGAVVKTTSLSNEFNYEAFCAMYGPSAVVLFVVEETGRLRVAAAGERLAPKPGQKLISLVDPTDGNDKKPQMNAEERG